MWWVRTANDGLHNQCILVVGHSAFEKALVNRAADLFKREGFLRGRLNNRRDAGRDVSPTCRSALLKLLPGLR